MLWPRLSAFEGLRRSVAKQNAPPVNEQTLMATRPMPKRTNTPALFSSQIKEEYPSGASGKNRRWSPTPINILCCWTKLVAGHWAWNCKNYLRTSPGDAVRLTFTPAQATNASRRAVYHAWTEWKSNYHGDEVEQEGVETVALFEHRAEGNVKDHGMSEWWEQSQEYVQVQHIPGSWHTSTQTSSQNYKNAG